MASITLQILSISQMKGSSQTQTGDQIQKFYLQHRPLLHLFLKECTASILG
jgi:hypothetical protein